MIREFPVTAVQEALHRRWRLLIPVYILLAIIVLIGIVGTEPHSGIPYRIWRALPTLFPEDFAGRQDYSAFGFVYESDASGHQRDLPIGISLRTYRDVDIVWFNCATCHTGTVNATMSDPNGRQRTGRHIIPGMPSNNLYLERFIRFLLNAGADERLSPDKLIAEINKTGPKLGPIDEFIYRWYIIPTLPKGYWSGARGSFRCLASSRHGALAASIPSIRTSSFRPTYRSHRCSRASRSALPTFRQYSTKGPAKACICSGMAITPSSRNAIYRRRSEPASRRIRLISTRSIAWPDGSRRCNRRQARTNPMRRPWRVAATFL
jgi:hypothetical protein